jgi:hypothetical protein
VTIFNMTAAGQVCRAVLSPSWCAALLSPRGKPSASSEWHLDLIEQ